MEYSIGEADDDDEFPPLPSDIEVQTNPITPDPYDNRNFDFSPSTCPSPPFPSPPPPPRIYANAHTFASIRNHDKFFPTSIAFATQFNPTNRKKKARAPIASFLQSDYVNMPIPTMITHVPSEVTYATLMTTTSIMPTGISSSLSFNTDFSTNHVEYQQIEIQRTSSEINDGRVYENIKCCPSPPSPCYTPSVFSLRPPSWSSMSVQFDEPICPTASMPNNDNTPPDAHVYVNLQCQEDEPPVIPIRTCKIEPILIRTPSPPPLPPRNEHRSDSVPCPSTVDLRLSPVPTNKDDETLGMTTTTIETCSNASSLQSAKAFELNMVPSCDDKTEMYRTKILHSSENPPSVTRQRRTLHSVRRRRLRGSVALRGSIAMRRSTSGNSNRRHQQQQPQQSNITVRHPMVTDDRWRRTLRKRRRQRAVQMKLDGNVLSQQTQSTRPVSDHTYNEIKQPILAHHRTRPNGVNNGGVLERAMQFNGALRDRVFSWYRGAGNNPREQQPPSQQMAQVLSASDNGESDQKDATTTNEDDEEEEEFFTHATFEDFLLRRRPKSSGSTTVSGSSTIVSQLDSVVHRLPVRTPPDQKPHVPPPPAPPLLPSLPPTPPPARRFPGLALSLDKTDVDFIHNMLQRTRGDHRVWNRITALKEAYIRATSKKNNLPKKPKVPATHASAQMDDKKKKKDNAMKHSLAATKIRAELEKYDELPASSATILDEDDYDETCSATDDRRLGWNSQRHRHHHSTPALPETPTTVHRLLNFVTSIKRRAQTNVQQLQKNLHDIRSRVHLEAMTTSINHQSLERHASTTSRQRPTFINATRVHMSRAETNTTQPSTIVRRTNSHRSAVSIEQTNALHRRQVYRTHSNVSHSQHHHHTQQRHTHRQRSSRLPSETITGATDRSPSVTNRSTPIERHSSRKHTQPTLRPQRSRKD